MWSRRPGLSIPTKLSLVLRQLIFRAKLGHSFVVHHRIIQLHDESLDSCLARRPQPYSGIAQRFHMFFDLNRPLDHGAIVKGPIEPDLPISMRRSPPSFRELTDEPRSIVAFETHHVTHLFARLSVNQTLRLKQSQ